MESTSSFPIGFKYQSRGNRVTVDKQGDVQFWPVGGDPTWVTSWPLLSWWPGYSKHLPLFQTVSAVLATASRTWFTKRRAASLEGSPVYWAPPGPRRFLGCYLSSPPSSGRDRGPQPHCIAGGTARVPLHSSPGTSESVGPGPESQCVFIFFFSNFILFLNFT